MVLESNPESTRANQSQAGASQIQPKPEAAGASQSQPKQARASQSKPEPARASKIQRKKFAFLYTQTVWKRSANFSASA